MKGKISKRTVGALKAGEIIADAGDGAIKGFTARRLASGTVVYGFRFRDKTTRKEHWVALGQHGQITADEARVLAKKHAGKVADNRNPAVERERARAEAAKARAADTNTVDTLLDNFMDRYVRESKLRKGDEVERVFNVYVRPRIGALSIYAIGRRAVMEMLDQIADENGPVMADRTLAHLRKAFNWQAARDDHFNTPIVKGMARTKPAERARKRILDDQEIRDVWRALDVAEIPTCCPAYVRTLLLTGQRRSEVAEMRWEEIEDSTWIISPEKHKAGIDGTEKVVPLPGTVLQLLGKPQEAGFVFTSTDGEVPFSGFSKAKRALDAAVTALRKREKRKPMPHWTLHDLRRTARSLMSRAGVAADIAERVLGHKIPGVRGVYDRYEYRAEKRDALERLAGQLERIINSTTTDVVPLARTAERA
jgi:integrase